MKLKQQFDGKRIILCMLALYLLGGVIFLVGKKDCGLSSIRTIEDLNRLEYTLEYMLGDAVIDESIDPSAMKIDADTVLVVKPTGKILQTNASFGQEFRVKKVIRSMSDIEPEEICMVYTYYGFMESEGGIKYSEFLNLMNPQKEYLLFCNESPLNREIDLKTFILSNNYLGYISIDGKEVTTYTGNREEISIRDVIEYDFFSSSDKITAEFNEARKNLLEEWLQ